MDKMSEIFTNGKAFFLWRFGEVDKVILGIMGYAICQMAKVM